MYYILYFIVGLFFGSFYYVVGDRGPKNENYINSRSRCDYCLHELKWYELIPLFSYIFQREELLLFFKSINLCLIWNGGVIILIKCSFYLVIPI